MDGEYLSLASYIKLFKGLTYRYYRHLLDMVGTKRASSFWPHFTVAFSRIRLMALLAEI